MESPESTIPVLHFRTNVAVAEAATLPPPPTKEQLIAYATSTAKAAGLRPERVKKVIDCETRGTWDPKIQSGHFYSFSDPSKGIVKGEQEQSFGLVQIHLPAHPSISYEQATDPYFAIDFLVSEWKEGRQRQWTCWVIHYGP